MQRAEEPSLGVPLCEFRPAALLAGWLLLLFNFHYYISKWPLPETKKEIRKFSLKTGR
jgi:hypothetical protein